MLIDEFLPQYDFSETHDIKIRQEKRVNITMKNDFAFTHWACFDCRKSFAKEPVAKDASARKCPECANPMIDMGAYFEPPRRLNKRRWKAMKVLAEHGYKFQSEGSKIYIETFILGSKNPSVEKVKENIEAENKNRLENQIKQKELYWEKIK